jgi:predicted DNA-binding protein
MIITLPPQEEAKLIALAQAKGVSPEAMVREALEKILAEASDGSYVKEPTRSLRGLLAKYGSAPSTEEIDENRAEMFSNFADD